MTQKNNSLDKIRKSEELIDEVIGDLKKLIVEDKKCVSIDWIVANDL